MRLKKEGRIDHEIYDNHANIDGFNLLFKHPHFSHAEMSALQRRLAMEEFERLGPSIFRILEDRLQGAVHLRDHPVRRVREKARKYAQDAHKMMLLIPPSRRYVAPPIRTWLDELAERTAAETGEPTVRERLLSRVISPMLMYSDLKIRLGLNGQPGCTRGFFRMND